MEPKNMTEFATATIGLDPRAAKISAAASSMPKVFPPGESTSMTMAEMSGSATASWKAIMKRCMELMQRPPRWESGP